jgi:hypothetical protein
MYTRIPSDVKTYDASSVEAKCALIGGRTGVVAGLLMFVAIYAYIHLHYGLFVGLALGWLPGGLAAWLTAIAVDWLVTHMARGAVPLMKKLMSYIRHFNLPM